VVGAFVDGAGEHPGLNTLCNVPRGSRDRIHSSVEFDIAGFSWLFYNFEGAGIGLRRIAESSLKWACGVGINYLSALAQNWKWVH